MQTGGREPEAHILVALRVLRVGLESADFALRDSKE
jgi:hypothetical protein